MAKKKNDLVKQKEEIALIEQEKLERDRLRKVREEIDLSEIQESIEAREEARKEALARQQSFGTYCKNIKKSLLSETMISLYEQSLPKDMRMNNSNKAIGTALINTFIEKEGVDSILINNKYKSLFLSEMNRLVNTYHKLIVESIDKEDPYFSFKDSYKDDFFEEIKGQDFDEISDMIRMRVSDAMEDFVQSNINNKYDIDEVINHTKQKIDNAGYGTSEELKQEYANMGKRRINEIKNRKIGIMESLIQNISKSTVASDALKESYINEEGKLNMDKIVESATAIYTFLEMMNTAKFIDIDEYYIKDFLGNLESVNEGKIKDKISDIRKKKEKDKRDKEKEKNKKEKEEKSKK